jgi:hypothetical protein
MINLAIFTARQQQNKTPEFEEHNTTTPRTKT